jgi:hypothetical protein
MADERDEPTSLSRVPRALRSILPAVALAAIAMPIVREGAARASWSTLGRDQGIFQYVAWAIGQGDVAYRDVRDVNGPLVPLIHLVMQALGGADEHRFRALDLGASALAFGVVGACLVDLDRTARAGPRLATALRVVDRAAWALAAIVALGAQYLVYGFWDTAQRESFFDGFVLVGIGAGLVGQRALADVVRGERRDGRAFLALLTAGAASTASVLGKPTYLLFAFAQLAALLLDPLPIPRRLRFAPFALGAALGLAVPFGFLVLRGDLSAWARITFVDVPAMYRFIWPRPVAHLFEMPGYARTIGLGAASSLAVLGLVWVRALPVRALALALMPVLGFASVVAQAKGFPYHFHPVSAGTTVAFLAVLRALAAGDVFGREDAASSRQARSLRIPREVLGAVVALGVAVGLGVRSQITMRAMPWPEVPAEGARSPEELDREERLRWFERVDFFPSDLRRAAGFLAAHTRPDERVQTYGMDAYVLFLARRRSATPFIYAYDLNVDAALVGAAVFGGPPPSEAQKATIRAMRDAHEREMLAAMKARPPAAFVFHDTSPLMSSRDAVLDFAQHCPDASAWVGSTYDEAARFGEIQVWLPRAR